jgi:hypothetical protein
MSANDRSVDRRGPGRRNPSTPDLVERRIEEISFDRVTRRGDWIVCAG